MVDAEVGEDPDGEAGAANPMQVKCVAQASIATTA